MIIKCKFYDPSTHMEHEYRIVPSYGQQKKGHTWIFKYEYGLGWSLVSDYQPESSSVVSVKNDEEDVPF